VKKKKQKQVRKQVVFFFHSFILFSVQGIIIATSKLGGEKKDRKEGETRKKTISMWGSLVRR